MYLRLEIEIDVADLPGLKLHRRRCNVHDLRVRRTEDVVRCHLLLVFIRQFSHHIDT